MSGIGPEPMMGLYAQQAAIQAAARALVALLPPGTDRIEYQGVYVIPHIAQVFFVYTPDGRKFQIPGSWDVTTPFAELRRVMYTPGKGTWFSLTMTVSASGPVQTAFNYSNEPPDLPGTGPATRSYLADLQWYPIDEDIRPDWLKQRIAAELAAVPH